MLNYTGSGRHFSIATPRWSALPVLEIARRLNERCIALLAQSASTEIARLDFNGVFAPQALWAQVGESVCQRVARCPVLLLELNFRRPEWWSAVLKDGPEDPLARKSGSLFAGEHAVGLLREVLIEARTFARTMPHAVRFAFGMAPDVGALIAEISIADIDRIATIHLRDWQPRWKRSRTFWNRLLQAAVDGNDEALAAVHLHAIQLLGGECLVDFGEPRASASARTRSTDRPSARPLAPIVRMNVPSKESI